MPMLQLSQSSPFKSHSYIYTIDTVSNCLLICEHLSSHPVNQNNKATPSNLILNYWSHLLFWSDGGRQARQDYKMSSTLVDHAHCTLPPLNSGCCLSHFNRCKCVIVIFAFSSGGLLMILS